MSANHRTLFPPRLKASAITVLITLTTGVTPLAASAGDSPDALYVSVGLPGTMIGYSRNLSPSWGWRADYAARSDMRSTFKSSGINYTGSTDLKRLALFADHFPFKNGFRVTGGLTINKTDGRFDAIFDGSTPVTIGGSTVTPTASTYVRASVKMPVLTPYLGIGWGHHDTGTGLDFVADLGVMIGRLKIDVDTNVRTTFPAVTQADVDAEVQKIRDHGIGKTLAIPQASVGMSFRY